MSAYMSNIKNPKKTNNNLRCKCGSIRMETRIYQDDEGLFDWVEVYCKKCNRILYYNGA